MLLLVFFFRMNQRITAIPRQQRSKTNGFLNMIGIGNTFNSPKDCMDVQVTEIEGRTAADACSVNLNTAGELFKPIPWNIDGNIVKKIGCLSFSVFSIVHAGSPTLY